MAESRSHKKAKGNAARKEIPIKGERRLDAIRGNYAIEVERSGSKTNLNKALNRLKTPSNKIKKEMDYTTETELLPDAIRNCIYPHILVRSDP